MSKSGWYKESYRHYLAAKGIKTNRYNARRGTLLSGLKVTEDTSLGNLATRFTKNVERNRLRQFSELPQYAQSEAVQREVLLSKPVLERPLTFEEKQLAQELAQLKLTELQQQKDAVKEAQIRARATQSEQTFELMRQRHGIFAEDRAKRAAEVEEQRKAKLDFEEKMQELRSNLSTVKDKYGGEVRIPPEWFPELAARAKIRAERVKFAQEKYLDEKQGSFDDGKLYNKILIDIKRSAIDDFAADLSKVPKLRNDLAIWLKNVKGDPATVSRYNPDFVIASYQGPGRDDLLNRVKDATYYWENTVRSVR